MKGSLAICAGGWGTRLCCTRRWRKRHGSELHRDQVRL